MFSKQKHIIVATILCITLAVSLRPSVFAQTTPSPSATPSSNPEQYNALQDKIKQLESKVAALKSEGDSLSAQIGVMDNQMKLTEYRVNATQQEITDITLDIDSATKRMGNLEGSLNNVSKVLINRIIETYKSGNVDIMQVLLTSDDVSEVIAKVNYMKVVQAHDKRLLYDTQQAKNDYENQKNILETKKQKIEALKVQLVEYTKQLDQQKGEKKRLLAETQGDEQTYQSILEQTRAQLARFSSFTSSQGGASLLSNQTVCDDWGCYYNQRDSQWGGTALNGTGYTLASDGCLVTSMAMVYTHYGHKDVTPLSINSISSNFAGIPAALLKKNIIANGVSSNRVTASIDTILANGDPVIVGISYDRGPLPDHFLVIISGSNGNYMMNDPFTPNAHNVPFTSKYSVSSIREIEKVVL